MGDRKKRSGPMGIHRKWLWGTMVWTISSEQKGKGDLTSLGG